MSVSRSVWAAAVLAAMAAACSQAVRDSYSDETGDGGAPHYDGGSAEASPSSSGGDGSAQDATSAVESGSPSTESGAETASSDDAASDTGAGSAEAASDAPNDGVEASLPEAGTEAGADASSDSGSEGGSDAAGDARSDASSFVPPTCTGSVSAGEYGGAGNQATTSNSQTWLMTWDATNLYVAIENATVTEGNVLYIAIDAGSADASSGGAASGYLYDLTDVTSLPFAAQLVVYAHDGYAEARVATGGTWGGPNTSAVTICDNSATGTRQEVIPWSLVGGLPASFGWTGYLAGNTTQNPQGYIYGQMPQDDPSGSPATSVSFTKYFLISNTTTAVGSPFATDN